MKLINFNTLLKIKDKPDSSQQFLNIFLFKHFVKQIYRNFVGTNVVLYCLFLCWLERNWFLTSLCLLQKWWSDWGWCKVYGTFTITKHIVWYKQISWSNNTCVCVIKSSIIIVITSNYRLFISMKQFLELYHLLVRSQRRWKHFNLTSVRLYTAINL